MAESGAREAARQVLGDRLDEAQVNKLFDEVLTVTKKAWGSCPSCRKQVQVEVPDAKSVVAAIADIVTKIAALPKSEDETEQIVFERIVYLAPDEDSKLP